MKFTVLNRVALAAILLSLSGCASAPKPTISLSFENNLDDSGPLQLKGSPSKNESPVYADGVQGKSLALKPDFWVDLTPTGLDISKGLTIEAWVKSSEADPSKIGGIRTIDFVEFGTEDAGIPAGISAELELAIMAASPKKPQPPPVAETMAFGGMATSSKPFPLNEWVHLAMTYDPPKGALTLFVNGDPVGSSESAAKTPAAYKIIRLGRNVTGNLDELRIYNEVLSPDQVKKDGQKK